MVPTGGTFFFLLILVGDALGKRPYHGNRPDHPPPGFKYVARKLMMDCVKKGYEAPMLPPPENAPENSDVPDLDRRPENSTLFSNYQYFLSSVSPGDTKQDPVNRISLDQSSQLDIVQTMWNFTSFTSSIKLLKSTTEKSTCFIRAYVAPMCWRAVITKGESLDLDDYDTMLWCARRMLMRMSPPQMRLPRHIKIGHMERMMNVLKEVCEDKSERHKAQVTKWVREQTAQNFFNCTLRPQRGPNPKAKPSSKPPHQSPTGKPPNSDTHQNSNQDAAAPGDSGEMMESCPSNLEWLNLEAMQMLGPCLLRVPQRDVEALDNSTLCQFFKSDKFKHGFSGVTRMKPAVGRRFLQKISDCFKTTEKFTQYVDRLGILACYYKDLPKNKPAFSKKLLSQLQKCENPESKKMKRDLVKLVISQGVVSDETLSEIGSNINQASAELLAKIPKRVIKRFLKAQRRIRWSPTQQRQLVKIQLGDKKCADVSSKDLLELQSTVAGASSCIFKSIKPEEVLQDEEGLRSVSRFMKKWQIKLLLRRARKAVNASELVMRVNGPLLHSLSLESVARANITLSQTEGKDWSHKQALLLASIFNVTKTKYRKLGSIIRGIICKKINKVADSDIMEFAQAVTDSPQFLSKRQAHCIAWRLFASLEKKRPNYFQTITEEELDEIPTLLLFCLHPAKVEKLPNSVCGILLDKISDANLTLVPSRAPSRRAMTQKALHCLTDGKNISSLTIEQLTSLGSLLCEIQISQLRLMNPDVRKDAFKAIGSCPPKSPLFHHRKELLEIVKEAYGDPSDFSPETVTMLGQVVLSDNIVVALPNKAEMKECVAFLLSSLSEISDAARKKLFELTTASPSAQRKKRQTPGSGTEVPTVELIMELDKGNIDWTATQLGKMDVNTFIDTVEILGAIHNFSPEQVEQLKAKAIEAWGPVEQMKENMILQMGCLNAAFNDTELEKLPLHLDTLNEIGKCSWNQSQMEAMWRGVAQRDNLTAQSLEDAEIISLDKFLCGLSLEEIGQLNMDAFKEAVDSIAELECSMQITEKLKSLAVSAYGEPKSWSPAYVDNLGNIMVALNKEEWMSLDPSVFEFLKQSSIRLIPAENFASFSVAQLQNLGPDNAAMVTDEQRSALDPQKLAALEAASTGGSDQGQAMQVDSGAPSLSVEGISAYMKPFLFLLLGFLLL